MLYVYPTAYTTSSQPYTDRDCWLPQRSWMLCRSFTQYGATRRESCKATWWVLNGPIAMLWLLILWRVQSVTPACLVCFFFSPFLHAYIFAEHETLWMLDSHRTGSPGAEGSCHKEGLPRSLPGPGGRLQGVRHQLPAHTSQCTGIFEGTWGTCRHLCWGKEAFYK